jgi:hypothetical protein
LFVVDDVGVLRMIPLDEMADSTCPSRAVVYAEYDVAVG